MPSSKREAPFHLLGQRLKYFREKRHESVAEVSGAVEIDIDMLERIENGLECPSEDILSLLINHFSLHEHEAIQLWEWAGLNPSLDGRLDTPSELSTKAALILVALDARVVYSDSVQLTHNASGIIMNFLQTSQQGQPVPVSRVGVSYVQAEQLLKSLQRAMLHNTYVPKYRLLPPGDTQKS